MAFINTVILIVVLTVTWNFIHQPGVITEDTHVSIQSDLKQIIRDLITEKAPSAKNITFHRFWTESINKDSVKAHFKYSYDDIPEDENIAPSKIVLDGYAIVNRSNELADNVEYWNFEEFYLLNNRVEYTEPLKISPGSDEAEQ